MNRTDGLCHRQDTQSFFQVIYGPRVSCPGDTIPASAFRGPSCDSQLVVRGIVIRDVNLPEHCNRLGCCACVPFGYRRRAEQHEVDMADGQHGATLWKLGTVTCTSVMHANDRIEIRLIVVGVVVQSQFFVDPKSAADFAIQKMHAYNAY